MSKIQFKLTRNFVCVLFPSSTHSSYHPYAPLSLYLCVERLWSLKFGKFNFLCVWEREYKNRTRALVHCTALSYRITLFALELTLIKFFFKAHRFPSIHCGQTIVANSVGEKGVFSLAFRVKANALRFALRNRGNSGKWMEQDRNLKQYTHSSGTVSYGKVIDRCPGTYEWTYRE